MTALPKYVRRNSRDPRLAVLEEPGCPVLMINHQVGIPSYEAALEMAKRANKLWRRRIRKVVEDNL